MNHPQPHQLDQLTGVYTRKEFSDQFSKILQSSHLTGAPLSVAMIDIDHFLKINETYGRQAGDDVLRAVAGVIQKSLKETEIPIRYGGDEFAILMPQTEREQAFLTMERIRSEVESIWAESGAVQIRDITVSGGLASYPNDGATEAEILRKADQALYRAKVTGRNKICLAYEEKMVPKTTHYTQTQLERLSALAKKEGLGEAELLREALDGLLQKYGINEIESM
ncbi:MAG: diguanylate cyclase [Chloroflexi bacterium]|nr:MAG: diguanylate cyclase [Chloroflexota bacterium]